MKTEFITVRLTPEVKEGLAKVAAAHNSSVSKFVRDLIDDCLDKNLFTLEELDDIANAEFEIKGGER